MAISLLSVEGKEDVGRGSGRLGRGGRDFLEKVPSSPPQTPPLHLQRLLALSNPFSHVFSSMGEAFTLSMKMII
jgi:hypothetical protein